jgi:molecular chaperone GrpE
MTPGREGAAGSAERMPRGPGTGPARDPDRTPAPARAAPAEAGRPDPVDNGAAAAPDVDRAAGADDDTGPTLAELEDRLRRALADLDNLRKRSVRELAAAQATERARVAAQWLPVLDNLERALRHARPDHDPVVEGVRAVRDQAVAVLADLGFPRHDETGVPFDPQHHEAALARPQPEVPPGTVLEVLRPGYGDGTHQLRPAAVVVATAPG